MLKELARYFGDTDPRCHVDAQPTGGKKATDEAPSALHRVGQRTFTRPASGLHRDWRPRLYW